MNKEIILKCPECGEIVDKIDAYEDKRDFIEKRCPNKECKKKIIFAKIFDYEGYIKK